MSVGTRAEDGDPRDAPLLRDPRFMTSHEVDCDLGNRHLPVDGSKPVKAARLLRAMVAEGPRVVLAQRMYGRDRPERWYLAQGHALTMVHRLVRDPVQRGALQQRAMAQLENEVRDMDDRACTARYCDVADEDLDGSAPQAMRVWFCATQLLLTTREAFEARYGRAGVRHCTLFAFMSGFRTVPPLLTEAGGPGRRKRRR